MEFYNFISVIIVGLRFIFLISIKGKNPRTRIVLLKYNNLYALFYTGQSKTATTNKKLKIGKISRITRQKEQEKFVLDTLI